MSGSILPVYRLQVFNDGVPAAGAKLYSFLSGTSTPQFLYSNADLAVGHQLTNPVVADANGIFPIMYMAAVNYRIRIDLSTGAPLYAAQDDIYNLWQLFTATTQTANTVYAGPSSGAAAVPGFRALVAADLPAGLVAMSLLHQGSGTDTTVAATNLDTYAIASQLTVKDTLFIVYELEQVTQNASAAMQFYNNTDAVSAGSIFGAATMLAGQQGMGRCWISSLKSSSKAIGQVGQSTRFAVANGNDSNIATFTTDWTGAWTLALRSGGQTSGGTIQWKWAVYRVAGQ